MAIQMIRLKCPACGANLEIESDRKTAFCTYCGEKILVHNDNEYTYRHIDEARLREIELEERELEEKIKDKEKREHFRKTRNKVMIWLLIISFVLVVISAVLIRLIPPAKSIFSPLGIFFGCFGILDGVMLFAFFMADYENSLKK